MTCSTVGGILKAHSNKKDNKPSTLPVISFFDLSVDKALTTNSKFAQKVFSLYLD